MFEKKVVGLKGGHLVRHLNFWLRACVRPYEAQVHFFKWEPLFFITDSCGIKKIRKFCSWLFSDKPSATDAKRPSKLNLQVRYKFRFFVSDDSNMDWRFDNLNSCCAVRLFWAQSQAQSKFIKIFLIYLKIIKKMRILARVEINHVGICVSQTFFSFPTDLLSYIDLWIVWYSAIREKKW